MTGSLALPLWEREEEKREGRCVAIKRFGKEVPGKKRQTLSTAGMQVGTKPYKFCPGKTGPFVFTERSTFPP
jgi:hypothetical protein